MKAAQAAGVFSFDPADHDVEAVLTRLGRSFVKFFCRPGAMSPLRTVISISERMPEIGKKFYETGPAKGWRRFTAISRVRSLPET
jgi:enoyl reductase-like protein